MLKLLNETSQKATVPKDPSDGEISRKEIRLLFTYSELEICEPLARSVIVALEPVS